MRLRSERLPLLLLVASLTLLLPSMAGANCASTRCLPGADCAFLGNYAVSFGSIETRGLVLRGMACMTLNRASASYDLEARADLELSQDGGATWTPYRDVPALGRISFVYHPGTGCTWPPSGIGDDCENYGLTVDSLEIRGGDLPVILRESPTLDSTGYVNLDPTYPGYDARSWTQLYLEVSADGGLAWSPGSGYEGITLDPFGPTRARASTWGALKVLYR